MMRRIAGLATLVAALLAVMAPAANAAPSMFDLTFDDYKKDGKIEACFYKVEQLREAKREVPNDIDQYAPDYAAALDAAIEFRVRGLCQKYKEAKDALARGDKEGAAQALGGAAPSGGGSAPAPTAEPAGSEAAEEASVETEPVADGPATTPAPTPEPTPAPAVAKAAVPVAATTAQTGGDAPAPVLLIAILGGLLGLGAIAFGVGRWTGWEPGFLTGTRHACQEAGWRASATWAEFCDWVRFGR